MEELSQIIHDFDRENAENISTISLFHLMETTETVYVETFFDRNYGVMPRFSPIDPDADLWFMQPNDWHNLEFTPIVRREVHNGIQLAERSLFNIGMPVGLLSHEVLLENGRENPFTEPTMVFLEILFLMPPELRETRKE